MEWQSEATHSAHILVVEDHSAQRETLIDMLEEEGFCVTGCPTGEEALAHLVQARFAVVITDLRLPDMQGTQLLEHIVAQRYPCRVLIHTAYGSFASAKDAVNLGAFAYVEKAGNPMALMKEVHRAYQAYLREYTSDLETVVAQRTASLQESEGRYRTLIEASLQGIYIHQDGIVRFANSALAKICGYDNPGEIIGQSYLFAAAPHERLRLEAYRQARQQGAFAPVQYTSEARRKDGTPCWLEVLVSPILWDKQPAIMTACIDITERKLLEERIRQSQKMEAIGTLAGGIAHDFNNILTPILGYTELALDETPSESLLQNYLQQILQAGERAKALIKQILAFSRQHTPEYQIVPLHSLLEEVCQLLRATLPSTITICQEIQVKESAVLADPIQLHQVFINLCTNAAHAMQEAGGTLTLRLETLDMPPEQAVALQVPTAGPYVCLSVQDTGHGIAPEVITRLFEPFFTTKAVGKGTGMGLAVAHGIVANHGGAITVKSPPGQGATFTVYLPHLTKTAMLPETAYESTAAGQERILLVDDEASITRVVGSMLTRLGYRCTVCNDSMEALEMFRATPGEFDLVITDQTMPQMTGMQMAKQLRTLRPGLPIILCTGYSDALITDNPDDLKVNALCMKPFRSKELGITIRRVLSKNPC